MFDLALLEKNLRRHASNQRIVVPALELLKDTLLKLDEGYDLAPGRILAAGEAAEAITDAINPYNPSATRPAPVTVRFIPLVHNTATAQLLRNNRRVAPFGIVARIGLYANFPGYQEEALDDLYPDFEAFIKDGVTRGLTPLLESLHGSSMASECVPIAVANIRLVLRKYLNLTILGDAATVQHRLRRTMLLLPHALPFTAVALPGYDKHGCWSCLVRSTFGGGSRDTEHPQPNDTKN